jgi:hypothetical protein
MTMDKNGRNIKLLSNQVPLFEVKPNSGNVSKILLFYRQTNCPSGKQ